jgi:sigma-B regulation protein RsbU (phosphoserine phosphatase)
LNDSDSDARLRELEDQVRSLEISIMDLRVLNDIATAVSSMSSLEEIIELIIGECIKHLRVEQAAVMLFDPEDEDRPFRTMVRRGDAARGTAPYRLDEMLKGWMLTYRKPLRVEDLRKDERFQHIQGDESPIRSVLSIPLLHKGRMIGLLNAFNKKGPGGFTAGDQRLLSIISSQSAQVIENARLHEEEQALLAVHKEMEVAYRIQMDLLPSKTPAVPGYDLSGISVPSRRVGGDYFDFIEVGAGRVVVCLGDVSGKGMPAALLMANLQATLRCLVIQTTSPGECLERANKLMIENTGLDRFITLFLGLLDTGNHTLTYASAGHNPPLLFKTGGDVELLNARGIVLGCFEDASYAEESVLLEPGDILLVYSDGVTEAINSFEEEFGINGVRRSVSENRREDARVLLEEVIEAVRCHQGGSPQLDDITLLTLSRTHVGS